MSNVKDIECFRYPKDLPIGSGYDGQVFPVLHADKFETDISKDDWGVTSYVIKIFSNSLRFESEVNALTYIAKYIPSHHSKLFPCIIASGTTSNNQQYIIMTRMHGTSLSDLMDAEEINMTRGVANEIRRHAQQAIDVLNSIKICHNDLVCCNVMVALKHGEIEVSQQKFDPLLHTVHVGFIDFGWAEIGSNSTDNLHDVDSALHTILFQNQMQVLHASANIQ